MLDAPKSRLRASKSEPGSLQDANRRQEEEQCGSKSLGTATSKRHEFKDVLLLASSHPTHFALRDVDQDGDGADAEAHGGDDCVDTDPSIHPGATDEPEDGIDQDCDGEDAAVPDPGTGTGTGTETGGDGPGGEDSEGCGCSNDGSGSLGWLALAPVLLGLRRRH